MCFYGKERTGRNLFTTPRDVESPAILLFEREFGRGRGSAVSGLRRWRPECKTLR